MGLIDNLRNGIVNWLYSGMSPEDQASRARTEQQLTLREYFEGIHKPQLRVKAGGADDNISLNLTGLVVDRAVSRLFGGPISFDLPGESTDKQDAVLAEIWDANRQAILLHKIGQLGAIYGTCFLKIAPEGVESRREENKLLPRLVALNPLYMKMAVDPLDLERVVSYVMEFQYDIGGDRKEARREVTELKLRKDADKEGEVIGWVITRYIKGDNTSNQWVQDGDEEVWPWEFAPILEWQNLPVADSPYGQSDIEGIIALQDRVNFTEGNISKIIRNHAHPRTWGKGNLTKPGKQGEAAVTWGADEIIMFQGEVGELHNIEMQSDLASATAFGLDLRRTLFDVTRTVDITSIVDRIGAITNLGLRLLFKDETDKLYSKRLVYGEALSELNHRLLVMSGFGGPEADGGVVVWPDPLPVDELGKAKAIEAELRMGTLSKQTAAGDMGRDWEVEKERIAEDAVAGGNIGDQLLAAFNRGG